MTINPVDSAILSTLAYAHIFEAGVKENYLYLWLVTPKKISKDVVAKRLSYLEKKRLVTILNGWVFWHTVKKHYSLQREVWSREKRKKARSVTSFFTHIPWIKAVGITGSIAAMNAKEDDDIDLLIITEKNRLWLTRISVSIVLFALGKLRLHHDPHVANKLCLNVWLEDDHLLFTTKTHYIAREIIQIHWIYERESLRQKFLHTNAWVTTFFGNKSISSYKNQAKKRQSPHIYRTFAALNVIAYWIQVFYMKPHRTTEIIEEGRALFHPTNLHENVLKRYNQVQAEFLQVYMKKMKR